MFNPHEAVTSNKHLLPAGSASESHTACALGIVAHSRNAKLRSNMNIEKLKPIRPLLLVAAIFGFLAINCPFLYFALIEKEVYSEAMNNGLALVFIGEAFLLMFFLAYIIAKIGWKKPGWIFFIAMSLLGSLAFSIPLQLYLIIRPRQSEPSD